jgi:hypothetical protein
MMAGKCGTCTACCKAFAIAELAKPAGDWCKHCTIGVGCKIYEQRPPACSDFKCLWLQSQDETVPLPEELRPDRCKVLFSPTTNERVISAITTSGMPDAWRYGRVRELIDVMLNGRLAIVTGPANATRKTLLRNDAFGKLVEQEVYMTKADENGMQWSIKPEGS